MKYIYNFLKKAGTYFLASTDDTQPRVRPFGTINLFEDKLYFMTSKHKAVSRQLHKNPRLELSAVCGERWLRLEATAVEDTRPEPKTAMLKRYPMLVTLFPPDSEDTELWFLRNVNSAIYSQSEPPEIHKF